MELNRVNQLSFLMVLARHFNYILSEQEMIEELPFQNNWKSRDFSDFIHNKSLTDLGVSGP